MIKQNKILVFLIIFLIFLTFIYSKGFVVIGDVRIKSTKEFYRGVNKDFLRNIEQINLLSPDDVVIVGDLIYGYEEEKNKRNVVKEWIDFKNVLKNLKVPYLLCVGNHEIFGEPYAEELYKKYAGELYRSIVKGNRLYILLNSEEIPYVSSLSPEQIKFLKNTLKTYSKIKHKYIFMHKPLWWKEHDSKLWFSKVHPILKKYRVRAVFAGHWHEYEWRKIDDIEYFVTGGGGAELEGEFIRGELFHFIYVDDSKEPVSYIVYTENGIYGKDFSIPENKLVLKNWLNSTSPSFDPYSNKEIFFDIKNDFGRRLHFEIEYNKNNSLFLSSLKRSEFTLEPEKIFKLSFNVEFLNDDFFSFFPIPEFKIKADLENGKTYFRRFLELKYPDRYFIKEIKVGEPEKYTFHYIRRNFPDVFIKKLSQEEIKKILEKITKKSFVLKAEKGYKFNLGRNLFPNRAVWLPILIEVNSSEKTKKKFVINFNDRFALYLNGKFILKNNERKRYTKVKLELKKGKNEILIINVHTGGRWELRVAHE